ncbi:MAG: hypothetical protein GXP43_00145 [bacterium]|nr:hypothetical protein [bacterium]
MFKVFLRLWHIGHFFLKDSLAFRSQFFISKLMEVTSLLVMIIFWYAILISHGVKFGSYSPHTMLSYFLYTFITQQIIASTRLNTIGDSIISGQFTRLLLYPISPLPLFLAWEIVFKLFSTLTSLVYLIPIIFFLKSYLVLPSAASSWLALAFFILGILIFALLTLIISAVGFFSTETWSATFLFWVLAGFLNGQYFPLDLLGPALTLNPFAYINYWPSRILLGSVDFISPFFALFVGVGWLIIIYFIFKLVWSRGLKSFAGWGN